MKQKAAPILVTGAHRSGTTWVGRTLAMAPRVAYIHEPFNLRQRPGICNAPTTRWYTYVSEGNGEQFFRAVKSTLELRYSVRAEIAATRALRDIGRMARDAVRTAYLRYVMQPRPLVKDPFAVFSAKWFADTFKARVVIVVRHPAGFASSILKKGWDFPFQDWLQQQELLRDHLARFLPEIEEYANGSARLLDKAILLWRAIHYVVAKYQVEHPSWVICRYEDLCLDPMTRFRSIFRSLTLEFSATVEDFIRQTTGAANPIDPQNTSPLDIRRHSRAAIKLWKKRLSEEQTLHIRRATADVAHWFYDDTDWG